MDCPHVGGMVKIASPPKLDGDPDTWKCEGISSLFNYFGHVINSFENFDQILIITTHVNKFKVYNRL